jgi:hypothetical protein
VWKRCGSGAEAVQRRCGDGVETVWRTGVEAVRKRCVEAVYASGAQAVWKWCGSGEEAVRKRCGSGAECESGAEAVQLVRVPGRKLEQERSFQQESFLLVLRCMLCWTRSLCH